jgi:hypothetical protein
MDLVGQGERLLIVTLELFRFVIAGWIPSLPWAMIKSARTYIGFTVQRIIAGCIVIVNAPLAMTSVTLMLAVINPRPVFGRVISISTAVVLGHELPADPSKRYYVRKVGSVEGMATYLGEFVVRFGE